MQYYFLFIIKTKQMENQEKINKMTDSIKWIIQNVENDLKKIKILINRIEDWSFDSSEIQEDELKNMSSNLLNYNDKEWWDIVEWVFDGLYMIGSDWKKYPVPLNYSSKSKLISQDILKLTIMTNWKLVYKLISPAPRNYIKATLSQSKNDYIAIWDNWKTYKLNPAAVSYFDLKLWEDISIIINADWKWENAAVETKL